MWQAKPTANGCAAWTTDKAEAHLLRKVLQDMGLTVKIEISNVPGWYTLYSLRVMGSSEDVLRGRELRRGFKIAMQLRGDVYDFLEGLRAGLVEAERAGIIRTDRCGETPKQPKLLRARTLPSLPPPKNT